jgi:hypothetical protein
LSSSIAPLASNRSIAIESKYCIVCHEVIDEDKAKSKYFEIKLDKRASNTRITAAFGVESGRNRNSRKRTTRSATRVFDSSDRFSGRLRRHHSHAKAFWPSETKLVGRLEQELSYLEELRAAIEKVDQLPKRRANLKRRDRTDLEARLRALQAKIHRPNTKGDGLRGYDSGDGC